MKPPIYMRVIVIITDDEAEDDLVSNEYVVNFSDAEVKNWLTRLITWAMYNSRVLELSCVKDIKGVHIFNPQQAAA
jgi:hypothetical protein